LRGRHIWGAVVVPEEVGVDVRRLEENGIAPCGVVERVGGLKQQTRGERVTPIRYEERDRVEDALVETQRNCEYAAADIWLNRILELRVDYAGCFSPTRISEHVLM
jgi:hypothetical protein